MAKRGGRGKRGAAKAKRSMPKRRARRTFEVRESASLTEVLPAQLLTANTNYTSYNISLAASKRAQDVAKGYQFYRIKRVSIVVKPLMDTFVQPTGSGATASVPYLYYMIDRVKQFVNGYTIDQLKAMGAKPRRLDDKTLSFSYTPSVLTETYDNNLAANLAVQYKMSPWLPTKDASVVGLWNPNTTDHLGAVWRVEQVLGTAINFLVERRIQFEFKKPAIPTTLTEGEPAPIDVDAPLEVFVEKPAEVTV